MLRTHTCGELRAEHGRLPQIGAAQIFQSFAQLNTLYGVANNLPASNPNNPFGQAVQTVTAYRSASHQEVDYTRFLGGLRGSIPILGGWDWDVYAQYSKSDATYDNGDRLYLDRYAALNKPGVTCTEIVSTVDPPGPIGLLLWQQSSPACPLTMSQSRLPIMNSNRPNSVDTSGFSSEERTVLLSTSRATRRPLRRAVIR